MQRQVDKNGIKKKHKGECAEQKEKTETVVRDIIPSREAIVERRIETRFSKNNEAKNHHKNTDVSQYREIEAKEMKKNKIQQMLYKDR